MTRRAYKVKLTKDGPGYAYAIVVGGEEVACGWSAGTKRDAKDEARIAANELGIDHDV